MGKLQVPITDSAAQIVEVPKKFELADRLQLAFGQLGDGFFAFKGVITASGDPLDGRTLKELNGEVLPGAGLQVLVRDIAALIDGIILFEKNKEKFSPQTTTSLAVSAGVVQHVVLRPQESTGDDPGDPNFKRKKSERGVLSVEADIPATDSGAILVATVDVPTGSTQVTAAMIDNSVRDYLLDIDVLNKAIVERIESAVNKAKLEIFTFLLGQFTTDIRAEIAAGDQEVLDQLNADVASLQTLIDTLNAQTSFNTDDIAEVEVDLATLSGTVVSLSAEMTVLTDDLQILSAQLTDFIDQTESFRLMIADKVASNEGDIVASQLTIQAIQVLDQTQDSRLTTIEQELSTLQIGGGGANSADLARLAVILANTNFKLDSSILATANKSNGLLVDVFNDVQGIDQALSDSFKHDAGKTSISGGDVVSTVEAEDAPVTKSAGWATVADAGASGGSLVEVDSTGETLEHTFVGEKLQVVYPEFANGTEFDIQVDSLPKVTINQGKVTPADQVVAIVAEGLPNVSHVVKITSRAGTTGVSTILDYEGNAKPEDEGWSLIAGGGAAGVTHSVADGIFTVGSTLQDSTLRYRHPSAIGNAPALRLAFRVRIDTTGTKWRHLTGFSFSLADSSQNVMGLFLASTGSFSIGALGANLSFSMGSLGLSVSDYHTYEVTRFPNGLWTVKVDSIQRSSGFEAQSAVLPWGLPEMGFTPRAAWVGSRRVQMDFLNILTPGSETKNRIDSLIVTGLNPTTKIVSMPFNSDPDANEAMIVKSDKLNSGAITYDILDNASPPNVLVAGATPESFEALGSAQPQLRLCANISGDAELEDWAGIAK